MDRLEEIKELLLSSAHIIYVQSYDEKIKDNAARSDMVYMLKKIEQLEKENEWLISRYLQNIENPFWSAKEQKEQMLKEMQQALNK